MQQQRRQVSEGAEPVPLFHLPLGARRRRGPWRGEAAAAWARIPLALRLGRLRAGHGPARRALPRPPAAANQPHSLAGLPGVAPAGGAAPGAQNARSRLEATGDRSCLPLSRGPQDDGEPQFSVCQAGRARAGPHQVPSLTEGARS